MRFAIRLGLVILGVGSLGLAYAFLRGVPEIVSLWPYPAMYGLGRVFLASIFAAVGAPIIWIGVSGDLAAVRPGAINIMVVAIGLGGQAGWEMATGNASQEIQLAAIVSGVVVFAMALILFLARDLTWRDVRPTPHLARGAFAAFVVLLIVAAGLLIQGVQIFPWILDRDNAFAYSMIFIGAAAYFLYGLIVPVWSNAKGQLIGFLAYDAVLILPYIGLWPSAFGDQKLGLGLYLGVISLSGSIALWFLFFSPIWRFGRGLGEPVRNWHRRGAPDVPSSDAV